MNFRKIAFTLVMSLGLVYGAFAQSVVLEQDVNQDTIVPSKGANRKFFTSSYIAAGSILGASTGDSSIAMDAGKSWELKYGISYKIRANNVYSLVFDVEYSRQAFYTEPLDAQNRYEKLILNNSGIGVMNRFNFGKRGNRVGNYLELGASGQYAFMVRKKVLTQNDKEDAPYKSLKATFNAPHEVNRLNYYADARLGFGHYIVYGRYLLSEILNDKAMGGQLPAITVGFMFDIGAK